MKNLKKYISTIIYAVTVVFTVVLTIYTSTFVVDDTYLSSTENIDVFTEGWYMKDETGEVYLPIVSREEANALDKELVIYHIVPENTNSDSAICIITKNEKVNVYVDDQLIYEYGNHEIPFEMELGVIRNVIDLDPSYRGKELRMELIPFKGRTGEAPYDIYFGCHSAIVSFLLMDSMFLIVVTIALLLVAVVFLFLGCVSIFTKKGKPLQNIYFSLFVVCACIWTATDGLLLQFISSNKMISFILFNSSFLMMPIPFALFLGEVFSNKKKLFNCYACVTGIYYIVRMILFVTGVLDFEAALFIIHIFMGVLIVSSIYTCYRERNNFKNKYIIVATSSLALIDCLSLIFFYINDKLNYNRFYFSTYFFTGIFIFTIIYTIGEIKESRELFLELTKTKYYEMCAFTDHLTNLGNRAAYDRDLDLIDSKKDTTKELCILMIDLNNLKNTNDLYGHATGDQLIKDSCGLLLKAFSAYGNVYRIGGDEMIVTLVGMPRDEVDKMITSFNREVYHHNENREIRIDCAIGICFVDNFSVYPDNVRNIARKADVDMYRDKAFRKIK